MTPAKQMVMNEINGWSDDKVNVLFRIIQEIDALADMSGNKKSDSSNKKKAFDELEMLRKDFQSTLSSDFDPAKELADGLEKKYGRID